uniref:fructokinase n=2 Tax=Saccharum spontaneum TaxID=62335 RepID=A0A678TAG6_SACSP|nr:Fructokinase-1 [Saccharum spontaneum]
MEAGQPSTAHLCCGHPLATLPRRNPSTTAAAPAHGTPHHPSPSPPTQAKAKAPLPILYETRRLATSPENSPHASTSSPRVLPSVSLPTSASVRCGGGNREAQAMAAGRELVVSFGEMLIDFVPTVAGVSLAEAPAFLKAPGGAPANVAIAVSRLGGGAAFVGKLGDDEFGRMLAAILRDNGVDDGGVVFDAGARTALAFVTLRADGEREFMFYRNPSADMLLTADELNVELIKRAAVFHYGSISLIAEPCRTAHLRAMEIAKEAGALLSYDPNLREALWPSREEARTQILSIWDQADIVKVSEVELEFLTGIDSVEDDVVMKLWRPTMKLLLVTLGDLGCKYYARDFHGAVPSFKVQQVDTTGAGDAFVGALLRRIVKDPSSLQDEKKLVESIKFANACGAITTTKKGAIPSLPTEAEVLRLIEKA